MELSFYTYDGDGNVTGKQAPAPNQTSTAWLLTSYSYDSLHRLKSKTYSDGSTGVLYAYDGATLTTSDGCIATLNPISPADANPIGYRTFMCDAAGAETWSRDSMGRILRDKRLSIGSSNTTQTFIYSYNKDGSEATLQYPSGRIITYAPNAAGRIVSAKDVANSINYLFGATYAPQGALASFTNHSSINAAFSYNSRLQPLQVFYGTNTVPPLTGSTCPTGPGNIMHRVYHFGLGANDNGNVQSIDNCRDTNRTVTYAYDSLNRVQSATTQGTTCTPGCWGQLFGHMSGNQYVSGYDGWGNLHEITATQGSATTLSQTMTNNNQFSGMTYDSAGNLTNDGGGGHTYTFDSENRLAGTAGWTYVYDGDGKRIKKCSSCSTSSGGTLYWMGKGTDALVESNLAGTLTFEYVFFNGKRVARRDNTSNPPTYYFADHLGSTDVVAGSGGVVKNESDYYPFGGEVVISNTLGAAQNYKFTGKERDSESNLDEFGARYYSSPFGRFMTPDWAAKPIAVPYADFRDPQTLNLYGYVRNNPLAKADADGHCYPVCTVLAGAALGALAGAVAETGGELLKGEHLNGGNILKAAGAGAITGAITGLVGPEAGVGTKLGLSVLGSVVGGATERGLNGQKVADVKGVGKDALAGVAGIAVESQAERSMASTLVRKATSTVIEVGMDAGSRGSETGSESSQPQQQQQPQQPQQQQQQPQNPQQQPHPKKKVE